MMNNTDEEQAIIFTIGHSTRPIQEFIDLLQAEQIGLVIDVRTIPKSRHNPQFNTQELARRLESIQINYLHMRGLGGLRHTSKDSINVGWRNASFRGFADYMQTKEFEDNVQQLVQLLERQKTAIMCAEAVPWRCHRSLIADALFVRGVRPVHIMGKNSLHVHELTPWAKVEGVRITYPKAQP